MKLELKACQAGSYCLDTEECTCSENSEKLKVKKDSQLSVCLLLEKAPYSLSLILAIAKEREKKKRPQYIYIFYDHHQCMIEDVT